MSAPRPVRTTEQGLATLSTGTGKWLLIWLAAIAVGAVGFYLALGSAPQRAWMSVWMNFLFWSALAMGGVVFGAVLSAAKGHWGKGFRRLAEATAAFLPISFLVFVSLYLGAEYVIPWLGPVETEHLNRTWLTLDGIFLRNGVLLFVLYAFGLMYLRLSLRADAPLVAEQQTGWRRALALRLSRNWRGDQVEIERSRSWMSKLAPVLILGWVFIYSLLSWDFIMSLTPGFVSIVWGPYYFVGGWLCMLALVAIMANRHNNRHGHTPLWGSFEFHDLGKLMFAFVVFWTYLWFAQFLVIWYGNLPREANFFLPRIDSPVFAGIYWLQMILIFFLPFVFLLGRAPKTKPRWLAFVAVVILVGFWVERYNLVVPSAWQGDSLPLGWPELLISIGFLGLFGFSYSLLASAFPRVPLRENLVVGSPGHGP